MSRERLKMPRNVDTYAYSHSAPWLPYAVAPGAVLAALPTTLIAHEAWGASPWTAAGLTVGGIVVTGYTWLVGRPRGPIVRATATGVAGAGSVWVLGAVISSPIAEPWFPVWAIGGTVLSIVVGVQRAMRQGGTEAAETSALGDLGERVKALRDARIGRATVTGARASAAVEMPPGVPFSTLTAAREEVESLLDVRPGAVRTIPSPDSVRRGRIEVVPVDQLRAEIPWQGPSAPGRSIAEPIVLGRVEDGEPLQLWLPGDRAKQRNSTHLGVVGMSGSGKTEVLLNLCAEVLTRNDAELWISDSRKADQLPEWLRTGAHRFVSGPNASEALIDELPQIIRQRAAVLGKQGIKQWVPYCGLPYLVVVFFEAAGVLAGNGSFTDIAESARSVGISLIPELQRASHDRIPTSTRSNIGSWICLGVNDEGDAGMALDDSTLDAGAAPWLWKDQKPGYLYAELAGTDRSRWALPARSFIAASEDQRAAAIAPYLRKSAPEQAPAEEAEQNRAVNPDEPPDNVDPADPITAPAGMPRIQFDPPERVMTGQEALDVLCTHIQILAGAGVDILRPAELTDVLADTGRSRSWLYTALQQFARGDDALLEHAEHGVYRIKAPVYA